MRCDRLASVIFRASGSKFRVTVRASAREIPHTTASRHRAAKTRSARPLLPARASRSWNLETPATASRIALDRPSTVSRLLPLSQPLTCSTAPQPHPLETLTTTAQNPACTPSPQTQKPLDLHDHLTTDSPIVLSSSPQPPAPCTFTPSAAPSMPQNAPELHYT